MQGARPWQIVVVILGLLVGGLGVYMSLGTSDGIEIADSIMLVDVQTGDLYRVDVSKRGIVLPMAVPGTDRKSMMPCHEQDGKWFVGDRFLESVKGIDKDTKAVNLSTGEITVTNTKPKDI